MRTALLLATLGLLGACQQSAPMLELENTEPCPVSLKQGQRLSLTLASQPSTGYQWHILEAVGDRLELLESHYQSSDPELLGSPGLSRWYWRADSQGSGYLSLSYQRPWEDEPIDSFECLIHID